MQGSQEPSLSPAPTNLRKAAASSKHELIRAVCHHAPEEHSPATGRVSEKIKMKTTLTHSQKRQMLPPKEGGLRGPTSHEPQ